MFSSKKLSLLLILAIICFTRRVNSSTNGGGNCLACTVIVTHIEQLAIINDIPLENALVKFCNFFTPGPFQTYCQNLILVYGSAIINAYI